MKTKISISFNCIDNTNIFNNNECILLTVNENIMSSSCDFLCNPIYYKENLIIKYIINNYFLTKEYYTITTFNNPSFLTTLNFEINLPSNLLFEYVITLSSQYIIYIYPETISIPVYFLGLINSTEKINVIININYLNITSISKTISNNILLYNNNQLETPNFIINGNAVTVNNININSDTISYQLWDTILPVNLTTLFNIYFYDPSYSIISHIDASSSIIVCIQLYSSSNQYVYSYIICLNLENFSLNNLNYNVLFFKNLVSDISFDSNNTILNVFDSFVNPSTVYINCNTPITNLYTLIIQNNTNLTIPQIPIWTYTEFNKQKLNINLIDYIIDTKYINDILQTEILNLTILVTYLNQYLFKTYNVYKINNVSNTKVINKINISNITVNCIYVKIVFIFSKDKYYSINGQLFLNNYNLEIYNKSYNFTSLDPTIDPKKNLILLLLNIIMELEYIKIYFYNELNDPVINSTLTYSVFPNTLYLYNNLFIPSNQCNLNISVGSYLKLNINLKLDYFILFLYSKITDLKLIFSVNNKLFKLLRIGKSNNSNYPNGNIYSQQNLYYIAFQNILEINIFMEYIQTGVHNPNVNIQNCFNIQNSINFSKNINNYWIPTTNTTNILNFTILNLELNQIYLYGENFINFIV